MTNVATFPSPLQQDTVSLSVEPGAPDVLSLLTTNIPQVHARLTDLRLRKDHPQNHPRQVWLDLSSCENFSEMRGDVLVRALRLTQFLPSGFVGCGSNVEEIARSARLPRIDSREFLPRIFLHEAPINQTAPRIEIDQTEDIVSDLRRRLISAQEENLSTSRRADVLSQALDVVREQRDRLDGEVRSINERLSSMSGQMEWSAKQYQSAEAEVASVMERLGSALVEQAEASSRAEALEQGMALVEQALTESRQQVESLQNRLANIEQEGAATAEQADALSRSLREFEYENARLSQELASGEQTFDQQRAEFVAANERLVSNVAELQAALVSAHEELSVERGSTVALVGSRNEVEKQSALTSQMLEDALARIEDLSAEVSNADASMEHYKTQWQFLNEDHQRARAQLSVAQEEACKANEDVVSLDAQCREQAARIQALCNDVETSAVDLASAHVRAEGLSAALEEARLRAEQSQLALDEAVVSNEELSENLQVAQREAGEANEAVVSLRAQCDEQSLKIASLSEFVSTTTADLSTEKSRADALSSALEDANTRATKSACALDETAAVANDLRNQIVNLNNQAKTRENEVEALILAREEALSRAGLLSDARDELTSRLAGLTEELAAVHLEAVSAQDALLDAAREVAHLQSVAEENTRAYATISELATRQSVELRDVRAEVSSLSQQLSAATNDLSDVSSRLTEKATAFSAVNDTLSSTRLALDALSTKSQQDAADFERRIAISKAEGESLARRLLSAQNEAQLSTAQFQSMVEDLHSNLEQEEKLKEQLLLDIANAHSERDQLRSQVASAVAARSALEGQINVLQEKIVNLSEHVLGLESTIVEQENMVEKISSELAVEKEVVIQLREDVSAGESVISRQQGQLEASRQAISTGLVNLQEEQQAHGMTRQERDAALGEIQSLTQTVEVQASTIVRVSSELAETNTLCSEQSEVISFADANIEEARSAARIDRKARAVLEIELVDAQDALMKIKEEAKIAPRAVPVTRHNDRVRSGQRITALGDLVITKQVSTCAELMAKGSVHIYGPMQGRVHAGCEGDRSARIYCLNFHAEQVAIAGRSVMFETIPANLVGRSVEVWLDEATDVMQVRPLDIP